MNMSAIHLELPTKLEELCCFSFNFNNLIKMVDYFHQNDIAFVTEIQDLNKRLSILESLKSEIEDIKIKTSNIENLGDNINRSFINIQNRMMSIDTKFNEISEKAEENLKVLEIQKQTIDNHDNNLNNLNKYVDQNIQSIKEIKSINKITKEENDLKFTFLEKECSSNKELINNKITILSKQILSNQKQIENLNGNFGDLSDMMNNFKKNFDRKSFEIEQMMEKIKQFENSNIKNLTPKNITNENNNSENIEENITDIKNINNNINNFNPIDSITDIYEFKNEIENLKKEFKEFKQKSLQINSNNSDNNNIDNNILMQNFNQEILDIQANIELLKSQIIKLCESNSSPIKNDDNLDSNRKNESMQKENTDNHKKKEIAKRLSISLAEPNIENTTLKKINENIKILSVNISSKPSREEFESLKRDINSKLSNVKSDQSLLSFSKDNYSGSEFEHKGLNVIIENIKNSLTDSLNPLVRKIIYKEIKNIDLSENQLLSNLIRTTKKHTDEILQNNKIINDLKNIVFSKETSEKIYIISAQVEKLLTDNKTIQEKITDIIKSIEGVDEDECRDSYNGGIINKLNFLHTYNNLLSDKITNLEKKHASLTKDIKDEIKNNLKNKTVAVVDEFKAKLATFTNKFEDELKNKIDQIGLYSFENKISNKFSNDLKDKLNKNELKKNNININRKIDSLENKISKTLVDTIIDLQMEDAPLIVKKNFKNLDVCASCNQLLPKNNNSISIDEITGLSSPNATKSKGKFGMGSYGHLGVKTSLVSPNRKNLPDIFSNFHK